MRSTKLWIVACAMAGVFLLAGTADVNAGMKGQIKILTKMPTKQKYKSEGQFHAEIRRRSTNVVYEEGSDRIWRFNLMVFFKKRLADSEVTLMFYDAKDGKYVDSQIKMTRDYNSDNLLCSVTLRRPPFDANKKYKVVAQDKDGNKLANGTFETRGTSQAAIDNQKRYENTQKEMEKSMQDLERRAKEQEEAEKRRQNQKNKKAADDLF